MCTDTDTEGSNTRGATEEKNQLKMQSLWPLVLSLCIVSESYDYIFINESTSWGDAQSYCREHHRDLATVSNMWDVRRLCAERHCCPDAWIGLNNKDSKNERRWHWSLPGDNYTEDNSRWSPGEPNDPDAKQNCVFINRDLTLADDSCCHTHPFICYDPLSQTSELIRDNKTWLEALEYCRQRHSDLLSGWQQLNHSVVKENIHQSKDSSWWIGLFRDPWGWSDGNHSTFRNWRDTDGFLCEDASLSWGKCAKLGPENRWRSGSCTDEKHTFICYDDKAPTSAQPTFCTDDMILIRENLTWEGALDFCRQYYSDLASITTEEQQMQAQRRAQEAHSEFVWLGSRYTCLLELWAWVSGEFVEYENWKNTESSECGQSAAMERGGQNKWVKKSQQERYSFICAVYC